MSPDAIMVFPDPAGVMTRQAVVDSIAASLRWRDVEFAAVQSAAISADVVLLTYEARAVRDGLDAPYSARASSVYVRDGGAWKLAFHQQTPGGPA